MLWLLCAIVFGSAVAKSHPNITALFEHFRAEHGRTYEPGSVEHARRFAVFQTHMQEAEALTLAHDGTATFGVTPFADRTPAEFATLLGSVPSLRPPRSESTCPGRPAGLPAKYDCVGNAPAVLPAAFDWRTQLPGIVGAVRYQGACGGCWAFSAVETVEAAWVRANLSGAMLPLSVQEILSGDTGISPGACDGGNIGQALQWVAMLGQSGFGLVSDALAPFTCSSDSSHCVPPFIPVDSYLPALARRAAGHAVAYVNFTCDCSFVATAQAAAEAAMQRQLVRVGPQAVSVNALPWKSYTGGIIRHNCDANPDHAVQVVGFGVEVVQGQAIPYWTIRNSWGASWGENGYMRLFRGENTCGVAGDVNFAVTCPTTWSEC